jgi:hypothetical protein
MLGPPVQVWDNVGTEPHLALHHELGRRGVRGGGGLWRRKQRELQLAGTLHRDHVAADAVPVLGAARVAFWSLSCRISKWRRRPPSSRSSSCCATANGLLLLSRRCIIYGSTKTRRSTSPMTSPLGCVRFRWGLQSLPTPSRWTMGLCPHPGTPARNRTSRACRCQCAITVLAAAKKSRDLNPDLAGIPGSGK